MAKKQVDAEQLVDNLQNAKFGLSIQNIVAIITVLSSLIAGWYTFTGRIDSLEEVVLGFADASDVEMVAEKFEKYDEDFKYLREKVDGLKTPKVKSYDGDIVRLENEINNLQDEITRLEKLLKDPLADFK